jgi:hypothetical protein
MELTIKFMHDKWLVCNTHPVYSKVIYIRCEEAEEAMELLQQLNGQPYEVLDAFQRTRRRLG